MRNQALKRHYASNDMNTNDFDTGAFVSTVTRTNTLCELVVMDIALQQSISELEAHAGRMVRTNYAVLDTAQVAVKKLVSDIDELLKIKK